MLRFRFDDRQHANFRQFQTMRGRRICSERPLDSLVKANEIAVL